MRNHERGITRQRGISNGGFCNYISYAIEQINGRIQSRLSTDARINRKKVIFPKCVRRSKKSCAIGSKELHWAPPVNRDSKKRARAISEL